jgi:hypothetical protein
LFTIRLSVGAGAARLSPSRVVAAGLSRLPARAGDRRQGDVADVLGDASAAATGSRRDVGRRVAASAPRYLRPDPERRCMPGLDGETLYRILAEEQLATVARSVSSPATPGQ